MKFDIISLADMGADLAGEGPLLRYRGPHTITARQSKSGLYNVDRRKWDRLAPDLHGLVLSLDGCAYVPEDAHRNAKRIYFTKLF